MEYKNRSTDHKASNQSPGYNYFPEQALRAGHMGSFTGRFHYEYLQDHSQLQPHSHAHPHPHPHPHLQPHHHPLLQSHDLYESIQREIEKQRIREEMIISEIARRRVLEDEVRRELMMERELAQRKGEDGFPFGPSLGIGYDSTSRFPLLGRRSEGRSLEGRVAMPHEEKERLNIRHENGEIETQPFQRCITEPRILEVKSVSERGKGKGKEKEKEKEKVVLLAKPHEYLPGEKRKAATSSIVDDGELPSAAVSRKKAKEEWSCALCQVSATSERALKDHVQGKKHKSKEAALRAQRGGKNYNVGLFPKKAAMPITVVGTKNLDSEGVKSVTQSMHLNKMGEMSSGKNNMPLLLEIQNLDHLKNNQLEVLEIQKDGNSKKKNYKFWCEMCQVGAFSRSVMNAHKKGKKHVKRLHEFDQNGADPTNLKKAIVRVNDSEWVAGDGKNTAIENVGKAVDVVSSEDHKTIDIDNSEDHEAMEAAKPAGNVAMSAAKADDKENNDVVKQEYNVNMDATKPVNNRDNDPVQTEYTEAMNAAKPEDNDANDAVQTEYQVAADAAKLDDYEADNVVKPEFTEAMVAAKPEDNKADDAAEPEFSEAANAAKPDHNQLDDESEA